MPQPPVDLHSSIASTVAGVCGPPEAPVEASSTAAASEPNSPVCIRPVPAPADACKAMHCEVEACTGQELEQQMCSQPSSINWDSFSLPMPPGSCQGVAAAGQPTPSTNIHQGTQDSADVLQPAQASVHGPTAVPAHLGSGQAAVIEPRQRLQETCCPAHAPTQPRASQLVRHDAAHDPASHTPAHTPTGPVQAATAGSYLGAGELCQLCAEVLHEGHACRIPAPAAPEAAAEVPSGAACQAAVTVNNSHTAGSLKLPGLLPLPAYPQERLSGSDRASSAESAPTNLQPAQQQQEEQEQQGRELVGKQWLQKLSSIRKPGAPGNSPSINVQDGSTATRKPDTREGPEQLRRKALVNMAFSKKQLVVQEMLQPRQQLQYPSQHQQHNWQSSAEQQVVPVLQQGQAGFEHHSEGSSMPPLSHRSSVGTMCSAACSAEHPCKVSSCRFAAAGLNLAAFPAGLPCGPEAGMSLQQIQDSINHRLAARCKTLGQQTSPHQPSPQLRQQTPPPAEQQMKRAEQLPQPLQRQRRWYASVSDSSSQPEVEEDPTQMDAQLRTMVENHFTRTSSTESLFQGTTGEPTADAPTVLPAHLPPPGSLEHQLSELSSTLLAMESSLAKDSLRPKAVPAVAATLQHNKRAAHKLLAQKFGYYHDSVQDKETRVALEASCCQDNQQLRQQPQPQQPQPSQQELEADPRHSPALCSTRAPSSDALNTQCLLQTLPAGLTGSESCHGQQRRLYTAAEVAESVYRAGGPAEFRAALNAHRAMHAGPCGSKAQEAALMDCFMDDYYDCQCDFALDAYMALREGRRPPADNLLRAASKAQQTRKAVAAPAQLKPAQANSKPQVVTFEHRDPYAEPQPTPLTAFYAALDRECDPEYAAQPSQPLSDYQLAYRKLVQLLHPAAAEDDADRWQQQAACTQAVQGSSSYRSAAASCRGNTNGRDTSTKTSSGSSREPSTQCPVVMGYSRTLLPGVPQGPLYVEHKASRWETPLLHVAPVVHHNPAHVTTAIFPYDTWVVEKDACWAESLQHDVGEDSGKAATISRAQWLYLAHLKNLAPEDSTQLQPGLKGVPYVPAHGRQQQGQGAAPAQTDPQSPTQQGQQDQDPQQQHGRLQMLPTEGMRPAAFRSWQVEDWSLQVTEALCLLRQEHCRLADRMLLQRLQHDGWLPAVDEATGGPATGPAGHKAQSSTNSANSTTATAALAAAGRFTRPYGPSKSAACTTTAAAPAAAAGAQPLPEAPPQTAAAQTAAARKAAAAAAASRAALMDHHRIEIQRMEYRAKIHSKAGAPIYGFLGRLWWGLQGLMQAVSFARPATPSSTAEDVEPDDLTPVEPEDAGDYMQDILRATRTHRELLIAAAGRAGAAAAGVSRCSGGQAEGEPAWLKQLDAALAPSEGSWCCDMPEDGLQV